MTTTLFPPVVETYIPAFLRDSGSCKIYFNFSQFNTFDDIIGLHLMVRNQYTNKDVLKPDYNEIVYYGKNQIIPDPTLNKYYISFDKVYLASTSGFELNESYKVQLRFISKSAEGKPGYGVEGEPGFGPENPAWIQDNLEDFSEWSTVGIIRGISTPFLTINNFSVGISPTKYQYLSLILTGGLTFNNIKEKDSLQSYTATLFLGNSYTEEIELIEKSEKIYTTSSNPNSIYYEFKTLLTKDTNYTLRIEYTTRAKYKASIDYPIEVVNIVKTLPGDLTFSISSNQERGSALISVDGLEHVNGTTFVTTEKTAHLCIRRTSSKSDFKLWETVQEVILYIDNTNPISFNWEDCTIESGIWYQYGFMLIADETNEYSTFFIHNGYIYCPFEDMFLVNKKNNLRIQFNQSVDSMKYVQTENIVTTLGSKYPYIIKGGDTKYKQFNISGMISVLEDIEDIHSCAYGPDSQNQELKTEYSNIFFKKDSIIFKELIDSSDNKKISLYDDYKTTYNISPNNDYIIEKLFRDKVMEFLTDNDVKLFKTMTEGNILVKLTNVSFTPNKTLGRNIYSFSATATEIAEDSVDNYNKFNIIRTDLQTGHFEYMLALPVENAVDKNGELITSYDLNSKTVSTAKYDDGITVGTNPTFRIIPMWVYDEEE